MHSLSPCQCCLHRRGFTCTAFPDGIPGKVMRGELLHFQSIEGDHGIVYAMGESEEDKALAEALAPFLGDEVLTPSGS